MSYYANGTDGDIHYQAKQHDAWNVCITVTRDSTVEEELYRCRYRPIMGLDGVDYNAINDILNKLIDKQKNR